MQSAIRSVSAREILDSRGEPTLEVHVETEHGNGHACVPSGASTGTWEAHELRDGDPTRFHGKGVLKAKKAVDTDINDAIKGKTFEQPALDDALIRLDGTPNRSRLGANALLGVSLAFARAGANERRVPLYRHLNELWGEGEPTIPQPYFNIINGGAHADSGISVQECMIAPQGATMSDKIAAASDIIVALKKRLHTHGLSVGVGDEGGFAPKLAHSDEALDHIMGAIGASGRHGTKLALDVAATGFFHDGAYLLDGERYTAAELQAWYLALIERYPIVSIEDPFSEEAWNDFAALGAALGDGVRVVGDDLTVTNANRIAMAAQQRAIQAVIIKPNQVGTLSETFAAARAATSAGVSLMVSHRSGETTDTFVADLAVALGAPYCKFGSLARGERVAKYNRLMEIEEELTSTV